MKYFNPYYWLRKIFVSRFFQSFFFNKDSLRKLVFKSIYKSNHWNAHRKYDSEINSVSGTGSNPKTLTTINLVEKICEFINNNNINEIVDSIIFLLSSKSKYINGHNLVVDGGFTAW